MDTMMGIMVKMILAIIILGGSVWLDDMLELTDSQKEKFKELMAWIGAICTAYMLADLVVLIIKSMIQSF